MSLRVSVGSVCHVGVGAALGGRARNEDNFLVCRDGSSSWLDRGTVVTREQPGDGVLLSVCDGMGGHAGGDVASLAAVRVLSKLYQPAAPRNTVRVLVNYLHESHRSLHRAALQQGPVAMGTTATVAWLLGSHLFWAHVGDSRLYLLRGSRLFRLTADQTRNEFARRDGRPATADGDHLAQSFIYGSRGLGNDLTLRIDKGIDAGAEPIEVGDVVVLCSDGLWGVVPDEAIAACVQGARTAQGVADALLELALDADSKDNVTIVVAQIQSVPPRVDEWNDDPEETVQF
jgi:serine/threonine protein phosphatase PrpC